MKYDTISVRKIDSVCYIKIDRPEQNNTINKTLIEECFHVLTLCEKSVNIVVLEGTPDVFCFGLDFSTVHLNQSDMISERLKSEPLYDVWLKLSTGPFITVAHVQGKTNAGGVGFVAACDIVIADTNAIFSLSELLFGIYPACVMPFLVRRIGFQNSHHMTLTTKSIAAQEAQNIGLVDICDEKSEVQLRKYLLRLKRLTKSSIIRYKNYMNEIQNMHIEAKSSAISANQELFNDPNIISGITRYIEKGKFPWEA